MADSPSAQLAVISSQLGLDTATIARTIGVPLDDVTALLEGTRGGLGNLLGTARLGRLHALALGVAGGRVPDADVAPALARIAAEAGLPAPVPHLPEAEPETEPGTDTDPPAGAEPAAEQQLPPPLRLTAADLEAARDRLAPHLIPTPTLRWPLLEEATGTETWVKHENHLPTGAFKVRGGLNLLLRLLAVLDADTAGVRPAGLVAASRGNHSQSLAHAGQVLDVPVTVVVPEGNSPDKNAATAAFGADLVVHGVDYQEAREHAEKLAADRGLHPVPPFHPHLVEGVATGAVELHEQVPGLDVVYVPIGMGSGACAHALARDALGLATEVVGVVARGAPAYARSLEAGAVVSTETADTMVDGVACRVPDPVAVATLLDAGVRVVEVDDDDALAAMALLYRATHNLAEPAGALALAAAVAERERNAGRRIAVVHSGGNVDAAVLARALGG